jgi:hypothetical protein
MSEQVSTEQPRGYRSWLLLSLAVLLLAGIVVLAIYATSAVRDVLGWHATLPDGTHVVMLGAAPEGTTFNSDKKWERAARRWLPASLQKWVPPALTVPPMNASRTNTNNLSVPLLLSISSVRQPWYRFQPEDDSGFRYPAAIPMYPARVAPTASLARLAPTVGSGRSAATGSSICLLSLRNYPRRQKTFLLRAVTTGGEVVATLRVPNPFYGPFPEWRHLPLPQSCTNSGVVLTIDRLIVTNRPAFKELLADSRVTTSEFGWSNARPSRFMCSDATSNNATTLSLSEPAWQIHCLLSRTNADDFRTDEKSIFTNLPVLAAGKFAALNQTAGCIGVNYTVRYSAGAGQLELTDATSASMTPFRDNGPLTSGAFGGNTAYTSVGQQSASRLSLGIRTVNGEQVATVSSTAPFIVVQAKGVVVGERCLFFARYNDGPDISLQAPILPGQTQGTQDRLYALRLNPPDGATNVTLTVMKDRSLAFDFMINPKDIQITKP